MLRHDEPMQTNPRHLPLAGAYNFRDLGGYPTVDRRVTRWGQLFRSDTLHELTEGDLDVLRGIGLASVIDLRTAAEVKQTGRGPLATGPISYLHVSVIQDDSTPPVAPRPLADIDLAEVYVQWLDTAKSALVLALSAICEPQSYPLVFHCAAGKDRTGVLAALVLDILGVERRVIVEDYELTVSHLDLIRARQRLDRETAQRMDEAPHLFDIEAATMEKFLDGLYEKHGGGREWALTAGMSSDSLDAMAGRLLANRP